MTLCNGLLEQLRLAREEETVISGRFSGEALHGGDLTKLDFRNVVLSGCHFTDCDFSQASFVDVRLEQCSFAGCRFFHTFWRRCALSCCKGDGANFCGSSLRETQIPEPICPASISSKRSSRASICPAAISAAYWYRKTARNFAAPPFRLRSRLSLQGFSASASSVDREIFCKKTDGQSAVFKKTVNGTSAFTPVPALAAFLLVRCYEIKENDKHELETTIL